MDYPLVRTREAWERARLELLDEEKALTRARDAVNARRRRLPMVAVTASYEFVGTRGRVPFGELFDSRRQLIVYFNMLRDGSDHICHGCSLFGDGVGELAHLRARDATFAMVSRAGVPQIEQTRARLGWEFPWYSCLGTSFYEDFVSDRGAAFGLCVFLSTPEGIFQTYFTTGRGVEYLGNTFSLADLTPYGRAETWEDSPVGRPQVPTHSWERLNDEYGLS